MLLQPQPVQKQNNYKYREIGSQTPDSQVVIQLVTAKSEFDLMCNEWLWNNHVGVPIVRESVKIGENGHITVVVDVDSVDHVPISLLVHMLSQSVDELDGQPGTVYFSEPLNFSNITVTKH